MRITLDTIGFFVLLQILQLFQESLACTCSEDHPQTIFCKSHFVVKAKVRSEEQLYGMRRVKRNNVEEKLMYPTYKRYNIRISRVYKESPEYQNATKHHIYTSSMDTTCGVNLKNNTKYLLQGRVLNGKPIVSLCYHPTEWHHVSVRQRKGYNFLYDQNCKCNVEFCWTPGCEKTILPQGCNWNQNADPGRCYSQHSMCVDRGISGCHWARTTLLKKCLETVEEDGRLGEDDHLRTSNGHAEPEYRFHEPLKTDHNTEQEQQSININPSFSFDP